MYKTFIVDNWNKAKQGERKQKAMLDIPHLDIMEYQIQQKQEKSGWYLTVMLSLEELIK